MRDVSRQKSMVAAVMCALAACACLPALAAAAPPRAVSLDGAWEIRDAEAAPAPSQPAPPDEGEEETETPGAAPVRSPGSDAEAGWQTTRVPGVFDPDAAPELFAGTVKHYRLRFVAPRARGYRWALRFEQARRRATVFLNGRRLRVNADPYTPFEVEAKGLRPGRRNELRVTVDSRKDPRLAEGWWNWGGITRSVSLVPRGRVDVHDLALLSDVGCRGPARRCRARVLIDGILSKLPRERAREAPSRRGRRGRLLPLPQPRLTIRLRSPEGRVTRRSLPLRGSRGGRRRVKLGVRVPAPKLWAPEQPNLYDARVSVSYRGRVEQVERMQIGLRSVAVKQGFLYLNNRRIQLRGASIHEDFPERGAALTAAEMDTTVRELQELGANVTRAHYVLSEPLLRRLDRAGIMVWNQAPVWQRDHRPSLLRRHRDRAYALGQVERTVKAARSHPSVITHSVANELSFTPDRKPGTRRFLRDALELARETDPTLPIAIDIKGRPSYGEQFSYGEFDIIGINQYFGWYEWVVDFGMLEPFLYEMRDHYPNNALVMTEFGAEGRPDMARAPAQDKGSYAFQTQHVGNTLDVVDRTPFLSGAIHWTLREFEIFPGWRGGALPGPGRNTRHHKGLLTYTGERKPAWGVARAHYLRTPLYP